MVDLVLVTNRISPSMPENLSDPMKVKASFFFVPALASIADPAAARALHTCGMAYILIAALRLSETEQGHVVAAYSFELGKVQRPWIRERQVREILARIDHDLARRVAANLGIDLAGAEPPAACSQRSPALSQMSLGAHDIKGRKVAVLVADGVDARALDDLCQGLQAEGAKAELLGPSSAPVRDDQGNERAVVGSMAAEPSVTYDAVLVPGGAGVAALSGEGVALHYLLEAYKHLKPLALLGEARDLADRLGLQADPGLLRGAVYADVAAGLRDALLQHRIWAREALAASVPA